MDGLLGSTGSWVARAHAAYGLVLLLSTFVFANVAVLAGAVWMVVSHARGGTPWPWLPAVVRRWLRLGIEFAFGLINPVLYLAVLDPGLPALRGGAGSCQPVMTAGAWTMLAAVWTLRVVGAALEQRSRAVRAGIQLLLAAAVAWVLLYAVKDLRLLLGSVPARTSLPVTASYVLRFSPLYLVPVILLWDYIRGITASSGRDTGHHGLFLLPDRKARLALAGAAVLAIVTVATAAHRRSDTSVRALVAGHRKSIRAAAERYDVDPRLIASIVYVTHRDQLSPFRDELERVFVSAWARNMRGELGIGSPDNVDRVGTDENPLLNLAFDVSVGVAQIKPRTAQTASVLATGLLPDELPRPGRDWYRGIEPVGDRWNLPAASRLRVIAPIPVPGARHAVATALLDDRSNLATCALILALYQHQWESANPAWSLRDRPEILATLYQLGFARSRPHAAPRSNAFGARVRAVSEERWLDDLGFRPPARHARRMP